MKAGSSSRHPIAIRFIIYRRIKEMKKTGSLKILMSFFFLAFSLNAISQHCYCPGKPRKNLYTYNFSGDTLKLCGFEYDAYNNDKIIGSFVLSQCSVDSLLI